jgi:hypothetical protein
VPPVQPQSSLAGVSLHRATPAGSLLISTNAPTREKTMALIDRAKNILLSPKTEWPVIAGETASVQSLYVGYVVILAAIGPIALAIRQGLHGVALGAISYAIALVVTYILAWIVDALAPTFGGEKDFVVSFKLTAYSYTAAWVGGIFHLIPGIGGLLTFVAAIYSFYTFYLGVPVLKKCPPEKAVGYTIVVVICGFLLGAVLGAVLFTVILGGSMLGMMSLSG